MSERENSSESNLNDMERGHLTDNKHKRSTRKEINETYQMHTNTAQSINKGNSGVEPNQRHNLLKIRNMLNIKNMK